MAEHNSFRICMLKHRFHSTIIERVMVPILTNCPHLEVEDNILGNKDIKFLASQFRPGCVPDDRIYLRNS